MNRPRTEQGSTRQGSETGSEARSGASVDRGVLPAIAAGGAIGSLARWAVASILPSAPGPFPLATFATNVTGCLLIGALIVWLTAGRAPFRYARPFLGVGVLGGFTTFSTAMLDARSLLVAGRAATAAGYLLASLIGGLAAVWLGAALARSATGRRRT